jgi:hypothetical protein
MLILARHASFISLSPTMYVPLLSSFKPAQFEPLQARDIVLFLASHGIAVFGLVTPATPGWKLFRAAICAPLASLGSVYWAYYTTFDSYMDQCGSITICAFFVILALQFFVFYPAEDYCFRVRPKASIKSTLPPKTAAALNHESPKESSGVQLEAEPIPPPWSWEKLCWASSLWWSWRGVGWNFSPPLPPAASSPPFLRTSTRTQWLVNRLVHYTLMMLIYDAFRAYMNCDPTARLFFTHHTPTYAGLTQWQRAAYSTAAAFRLFLNMERTYVPTSIVFVGLGGLLGWDSEYFAPWGWPPLFAGLADVWKYPGLSVAWSRVSRTRCSPATEWVLTHSSGTSASAPGCTSSAGSVSARTSLDSSDPVPTQSTPWRRRLHHP